jgi:hypothetical protein
VPSNHRVLSYKYYAASEQTITGKGRGLQWLLPISLGRDLDDFFVSNGSTAILDVAPSFLIGGESANVKPEK